MAKIFKHPRVYAFLHLPLQSASDAVLYSMKREYTQADFCHVVDYLREHVRTLVAWTLLLTYCIQVPGITIATDIICGFPGELTPLCFTERPTHCHHSLSPPLIVTMTIGSTEEDFQETFDLVEKYKFPSLFTNQVRRRPTVNTILKLPLRSFSLGLVHQQHAWSVYHRPKSRLALRD